MENVWQYLRANKLCGAVWNNHDEIVDACADAWNWFAEDKNRIKSIGTRDWATGNLYGGWYKIPTVGADGVSARRLTTERYCWRALVQCPDTGASD
jgi:hypothetical protein